MKRVIAILMVMAMLAAAVTGVHKCRYSGICGCGFNG